MKICKTCNTEQPLENFYSNGYTPQGRKKYKPSCKPCEGKNRYYRYVTVIKECLAEQGRELACEVCGYDKHKAALQFHHKTTEKNFSLATSKSRSKEALYHEISICDVLCANCHAIHHYEESSMKQG